MNAIPFRVLKDLWISETGQVNGTQKRWCLHVINATTGNTEVFSFKQNPLHVNIKKVGGGFELLWENAANPKDLDQLIIDGVFTPLVGKVVQYDFSEHPNQGGVTHIRIGVDDIIACMHVDIEKYHLILTVDQDAKGDEFHYLVLGLDT